MISVKSQNAMAEVLWYLKGIKEEDLNKIPTDIINYIKQNASKEYNCTFDYNKPLKDLDLLDETRGIIAILCYKYWCITKEQKEMYLKKINSNEKNFQIKMNEMYNSNNIFKNHDVDKVKEVSLIEVKEEKWYRKLLNFFRKILKK